MEHDHAIKILMTAENERLRQTLYYKEKSKKKTFSNSNPRHMTADKTLDKLARAEWHGSWKSMLKEAGKKFKTQRKLIEDAEKEIAQEAKRMEQEVKRREKEVEKGRKEQQKAEEKERKKAE